MLNVLEPGELSGEIALLDGSTRTAGAAAMEHADLLRIHRFAKRLPSADGELLGLFRFRGA
jgi:CRP-like cAMP-binding protein